MILHGHEYCVYHNANGDKQISKGVHYNHVDDILYPQPRGTAIPDKIILCKLEPPHQTLVFPDLQRCRVKLKKDDNLKAVRKLVGILATI